jgi:general stress protein 26
MFMTSLVDAMNLRPMTTLQANDDGTLWIFVPRDSEIASEVAADTTVALIYADTGNATYAHLRCHADLRDDRAKVAELWNPVMKAWYESPDDPNIQAIEVTVESAEYWDSPDSGVMRIVALARAAVGGDDSPLGEHGEIDNPLSGAID